MPFDSIDEVPVDPARGRRDDRRALLLQALGEFNGQALAIRGAVVDHGNAPRADETTSRPDVRRLEQVSQLPPELPQRVTGLAFDGSKLWATTSFSSSSRLQVA